MPETFCPTHTIHLIEVDGETYTETVMCVPGDVPTLTLCPSEDEHRHNLAPNWTIIDGILLWQGYMPTCQSCEIIPR